MKLRQALKIDIKLILCQRVRKITAKRMQRKMSSYLTRGSLRAARERWNYPVSSPVEDLRNFMKLMEERNRGHSS